MDDKRKYQLMKYASVVALVATLGLYALISYLDHRHTFTDLSEMKNSLLEHIEKGITIEEPDDHGSQTDPKYEPMDSFFADRQKVVEYIFTTAILGEIDLFYYNFDPNVYMADFPRVETADEEKRALFNRLTRYAKLENIRILNMGVDSSTFEVLVNVELIYSDEKRYKTSFRMARLGDAHHPGENWYISTSMHEIVKPISF